MNAPGERGVFDAYLNIAANVGYRYVYDYNGMGVVKDKKYTSVRNITSWLTGFTFALDYDQKWSGYNYYNNHRTVKVSVKGVMSVVLFYKGIGTLYSKNINGSKTYR